MNIRKIGRDPPSARKNRPGFSCKELRTVSAEETNVGFVENGFVITAYIKDLEIGDEIAPSHISIEIIGTALLKGAEETGMASIGNGFVVLHQTAVRLLDSQNFQVLREFEDLAMLLLERPDMAEIFDFVLESSNQMCPEALDLLQEFFVTP